MQRIRTLALGLLVIVALMIPTTTQAQIPEEFKNLKVLPEDISQPELVGVMRGFATGLGVRCWHCHVGEEGKPLSEFDFESDEKQAKRTAREMMKMMKEINERVAKIDTGRKTNLEISCATCHHGLSRPQQLQDVLTEVYQAEGIQPTLARYREIRDQYLGQGAYDFSEGTLHEVVESVARKGKMDEALSLQLLNAEFHDDSTYIHYSLGDLYAKLGKKEKALASFKRAVELDATNRFAEKRIEELEAD